MSELIALLYVGVLCLFGYAVTVRLLGVRNALAVAGLAVALGQATYLVVSNALGYVMPIQASFWVTYVMLAAISAVLLLRRDGSPAAMEYPPRSIWILLGVIVLLAGLAFARDEGSDAWMMIHFPLPATILHGNFPVMDPVNPWSPFPYHYGPALLAAAFSSITGLSIAFGYGIQPLLNAAGIVFIATGLAWELCRSWKASAVAGLLALGGTGLYWLYLFPLGRELFDAYVLGQSVIPGQETPFRWLTHAIRSIVTSSPLTMLGHRPIGMGFMALYAQLFALHRIFTDPSRAGRWIIVSILFGAALAHTMETTLVLFLGALGISSCFLLLRGQRGPKELFIIAAAVAVIALVQGGVLSTFLYQDGPPSFGFSFDGYLHTGENTDNVLSLWGWEFHVLFGLPFLLFPFVLWHVLRRKGIASFPAFLCLITAMHLVLPFFVHFLPRPHEMLRFFYVFMSLSSFLIGVFLVDRGFSSRSRKWRWLSGACVSAMLLSSALHLPVRLLFPTLRIEQSPLFPGMPPVTSDQREMHAWVDANTTRDDRFLMILYGADRNRLRPPVTFAAHTGRFVISVSSSDPTPARVAGLMQDIEDRCDPAAVEALEIRYAVVETPEDEEWFRTHCAASFWTERFPGIYEFQKLSR